MIEVLRNRTYRALFSAQVIALLGTGMLTVALGLLAFDLAGDAAGLVLGTALTIKMVAYVGVAPLVAALVHRLPKKAVLVGADAVRLAIALMLPFVTETWQIYLLVFVLQSASATFTPAFQSLIPAVLPQARDYTRALALSRLAYDLEALLSPTIAAVLLTVISYNNLFVGTAIGFAGSAVLVLGATLPALAKNRDDGTFWQRLPTGVLVFIRTPSLRFLMITNVVVAAGTAIVLVNSVVYAKGVTRTMLIGLSVVVGGLLAANAVTIVAVTTSTGWWALLGTWLILGMGTSLINTPSSRLLAEASNPENRNLVYTAQFALSHACFLVTYPVAGWIGAASLPVATATLTLVAILASITAFGVRRRAQVRDSYWEESARSPSPSPIDN